MDCKPTVTMLAVVLVFAVMNTLSKMAFNQGMHTTVLIILRQLTATIFLAPIAFFRERSVISSININLLRIMHNLCSVKLIVHFGSMFICRKTRPKMTTEIFLYLFFSALLG